ncbi:MAG: nucleotidyl transferase AbiEii/AbiGii toxin family protein [bacterium]
MLSYESLIAHAKERGMPAGKARGIAREYVQILTLKALYSQPAAADLVFLGGTALRFGHGLPRFSEDLDFDARALTLRKWRTLLEGTGHALSRLGLAVEVRAAEKGTLLTGDVRFRTLLQAYHLATDPRENLKVKLEANRPRYPLATDPRVVSGYGEMFPLPFAAPGLAFGEKILALLARELGRDIFDLFFMAGKRWAPDRRVLAARGVHGSPAHAILARVEGFGPRTLASMARRLEPFLFEPEQARLVAQAHHLLPSALEYLSS